MLVPLISGPSNWTSCRVGLGEVHYRINKEKRPTMISRPRGTFTGILACCIRFVLVISSTISIMVGMYYIPTLKVMILVVNAVEYEVVKIVRK